MDKRILDGIQEDWYKKLTCKTCVFCHNDSTCRRYPPQINQGETRFPYVNWSIDWCGKYVEKQNKKNINE